MARGSGFALARVIPPLVACPGLRALSSGLFKSLEGSVVPRAWGETLAAKGAGAQVADDPWLAACLPRPPVWGAGWRTGGVGHESLAPPLHATRRRTRPLSCLPTATIDQDSHRRAMQDDRHCIHSSID